MPARHRAFVWRRTGTWNTCAAKCVWAGTLTLLNSSALFADFQQLYQVRPSRVLCSPDVLDRYCEIYRLSGEAHRREVRFEGLPVVASVMPPGTVAFEGEVDQDRMGDW